MIENPPEPIEVPDFKFKLYARLKVFSEQNEIKVDRPFKLVATASKYGLIFVGTPTGVQCIRSCDIPTVEDRAINHNISCYKRRELEVETGPKWLEVNCDGELLAVCNSSSGYPLLQVYSVQSFTSSTIRKVWEVRLSGTEGVAVKDLAWNPGHPGLIALVLSDGSAQVLEVKAAGAAGGGGALYSSIPPQAQATCLCWSPKGKQVVVGSQNGSLIQYKPELKAVKSCEPPKLPLNATSATAPSPPPRVVSVHWLSNFQFIAVYKDPTDPSARSCVVVVNTPKNAPPKYVFYEDLFYETETSRAEHYFIHQQTWQILVIGNTNSMEGMVLKAGTSEGEAGWRQWLQEEGYRAELPLTQDRKDVFNVGTALETSSTRQIQIGDSVLTGGMPSLLMYAHNGVLCFFHMIYTGAADLPSVCSPAQPLVDTSGLHLFIEPPAQLQQSSQVVGSEATAGPPPSGQVQQKPLATPGGSLIATPASTGQPFNLSTSAVAPAASSPVSGGFGLQQQPPPNQNLFTHVPPSSQLPAFSSGMWGGLDGWRGGAEKGGGGGVATSGSQQPLQQSLKQSQPALQQPPQQSLQPALQQPPRPTLQQPQQPLQQPKQPLQQPQQSLQQPQQSLQQPPQPALQQPPQPALQQPSAVASPGQFFSFTSGLQQLPTSSQPQLTLKPNQQPSFDGASPAQVTLNSGGLGNSTAQPKQQGMMSAPPLQSVAPLQSKELNKPPVDEDGGGVGKCSEAAPPATVLASSTPSVQQESSRTTVPGTDSSLGAASPRTDKPSSPGTPPQQDEVRVTKGVEERERVLNQAKELITQLDTEMSAKKDSLNCILSQTQQILDDNRLKDKLLAELEVLSRWETVRLRLGSLCPEPSAVQALGSSLMEIFAWYEKIKARQRMSRTTGYIELMESQDLDPVTKHYLKSIDKHLYYLESQLRLAKTKLGALWDSLGTTMDIPAMEAIYQSLVAHHNILSANKIIIENHEKTLKKLNRRRLNRSNRSKVGELELSTLADRLLDSKLEDSDLSKDTSLKDLSNNYIALANTTSTKPLKEDKLFAFYDWHKNHKVVQTKVSKSCPVLPTYNPAVDQSFSEVISPIKQSTPLGAVRISGNSSGLHKMASDQLPRKNLLNALEDSPEEQEDSHGFNSISTSKKENDGPGNKIDDIDTTQTNILDMNLTTRSETVAVPTPAFFKSVVPSTVEKLVGKTGVATSSWTAQSQLYSSNLLTTPQKSSSPQTAAKSQSSETTSVSVSKSVTTETVPSKVVSLPGGLSVSSLPSSTAVSTSEDSGAPSGGLFANVKYEVGDSSAVPSSGMPILSFANISSSDLEKAASTPPVTSSTAPSVNFSFALPPSNTAASSGKTTSSTGSTFSLNFGASSQPANATSFVFGGTSINTSQVSASATSAPPPAKLPTSSFSGFSSNTSFSTTPAVSSSTQFSFGNAVVSGVTAPSTASPSASSTTSQSLFGSTAVITGSLFGGSGTATSLFGGGGAVTTSVVTAATVTASSQVTGGVTTATSPVISAAGTTTSSPLSIGGVTTSSSSIFGKAGATTPSLFSGSLPSTASAPTTATPASTPSLFKSPITSANARQPLFAGSTPSFGASTATTTSSTLTFSAPSTTPPVFGGSGAAKVSSDGAGTFGSLSITAVTSTVSSVTPSASGDVGPVTVPSPPSSAASSTSATTSSSSVFGTSQPKTTSDVTQTANTTTTTPPLATPLFGGVTSGSTSLFGTANSSSLFGSFKASPTTSSQPFFSNTPAFAAATTTSASIFGGPPQSTTTTPTFGTPTTNTFGSPSTVSAFGSPAATTPSFFASPSAFVTTSATTPTPTETSSIFGAANALSSTSFFGSSPSSTTTSGTAFGGSQSAASIFGGSTSFGTPATTSSSAASFFGKPICSPTSTSNVFGGSGNVFGAATSTTSASSIFGGGNSFQTKPPAFGQGNLFGQTTSTAAGNFGSSGGSLFGGGAASFSSPSQPGATSPSLFQSGGGSRAAGGSGAAFGASPVFGSPTDSKGFGVAGGGAGTGSPQFGGGPTFGAAPVFGGSPGFNSSPSKVFGATPGVSVPGFGGGSSSNTSGGGGPGSATVSSVPQQQNPTFENLATQETVSFGNLAQQQPFQSSSFAGSSFSSWR